MMGQWAWQPPTDIFPRTKTTGSAIFTYATPGDLPPGQATDLPWVKGKAAYLPQNKLSKKG